MSVYCIDTCSLIWAMRYTYPIEVFPNFWVKMNDAVVDGTIISSELVYDELCKEEDLTNEDEISKWVRNQNGMFVKIDQTVAESVGDIVKKYPKLVDTLTERNQADPYLVALAKVKKATLVTEEGSARNSPKRMKIPDVCAKEGVKCIKMLDMIKELGWRFG